MNTFNKKISSLYSNKGRIISTILAIVSISLAHYAGFLSELPLQIVAASGSDLMLGVTTTFIFYISFSAILARIIIWFFLPFVLFIIAVTGRAEHGLKLKRMSKKKKFVKNYKNMLKNENSLVVLAQFIIFILIMQGLYLNLEFTWMYASLFIVTLFLVILSGLFRANFLLLFNIKQYLNRLNNRPNEKVNAVSAALFTAVTTLVVTSFAMGLMRVNTLTKSKQQQITNHYFNGYASLIANSGSSTLLFEKADGKSRYIFLTANYALAVESKPKSFPLLGKNLSSCKNED